jgi:tetratricopeptide (TPR) repeat protein
MFTKFLGQRMQGIKAFVGHSFVDEDKLLIRAFTDHFDTLSKSHGGGFVWDHAEEAEALPLSQKVLAKIEGKNLFVGICTRKEQIFDRSKAKIGLFGSQTFTDQDFVWKTSDWIIQEIGLAVGKRMHIVIFLENGVRAPGGLHGNIEYIPFTRGTPHQAFDKFSQMLSAISPAEADSAGAETKGPPQTKNEPEARDTDLDPKPDWTIDDYEDAQIDTIIGDNLEALAKIDTSFKGSIFAHNDGYAVWQGRSEYYRLLIGKKFDFDKLKRLSEEHPCSASLAGYLAHGYIKYDDVDRAISCFEKAASATDGQKKQISYLGEAAFLYQRLGNTKRLQEIIEKIKKLGDGRAEYEIELVNAMRRISSHDKDELAEIILMEHETERDPSNTKTRFSLAYKHSELQNNDMALYHYLKIVSAERDSTTWNNLGVSYADFGMHMRAVEAYTQAADGGSTLAMSNLGFKLLSAGFLKEAEAQCKRALGKEDYEVNVPNLLKQIKETPDEETKKLKETLESVRAKAMFYREAGEKILMPVPATIATSWKAPEGTLRAELQGDKLVLSGTYEQPANALASVMMGSTGGTMSKMKIDYKGKLHGCLFMGTVLRRRVGYTSTLGDWDTKVLMIMDTGGTQLRSMENYEANLPSFGALRAAA